MIRFHCHYQDLQSEEVVTEILTAPTPEQAFEQFVQRRKADGWSPREIYGTSQVRFVDKETEMEYRLNAYGELTTRDKHH